MSPMRCKGILLQKEFDAPVRVTPIPQCGHEWAITSGTRAIGRLSQLEFGDPETITPTIPCGQQESLCVPIPTQISVTRVNPDTLYPPLWQRI